MENPVQQAQDIAYNYGVTPEKFWDMTPHELTVYVKARAEREQADYRKQMSLVWHQAAFMRTKKLPNHSSLMRRLGEKPRPQSKEEMINTIKQLHSRYGGKLTIGGKAVN